MMTSSNDNFSTIISVEALLDMCQTIAVRQYNQIVKVLLKPWWYRLILIPELSGTIRIDYLIGNTNRLILMWIPGHIQV